MSAMSIEEADMNETELQVFKILFSRYCRYEVNGGHCTDGDCEFCPVNQAYERIFNSKKQEEEKE